VKNRVRALRQRRGWSQEDLAKALGVSRQSVNAVENGRYIPSLPLALKLGRVFGEPVEAMFEDE
jgi:putative transcriptional regulator